MRCCYILKVKRVVLEILPDRCISPFYPNFYEYEMLIEREVCLFSVLFFFLNNRQQLRISGISSSQHKNYGICYRQIYDGMHSTYEKLVARLKIGLSTKQF